MLVSEAAVMPDHTECPLAITPHTSPLLPALETTDGPKGLNVFIVISFISGGSHSRQPGAGRGDSEPQTGGYW